MSSGRLFYLGSERDALTSIGPAPAFYQRYKNKKMKKIFYRSLAYIFCRYLLAWVVMFIVEKDAKMVNWSDLRNPEDWFCFFWLFGMPFIIDFITLGLPIFYAIYKSKKSESPIMFFVVLLVFLTIDFFISKYIYNHEYAVMKSIIGIILLPIFFRRELFYKRQHAN